MISKLDRWLEQNIAGSLSFLRSFNPSTITLQPAIKQIDLAQQFLATQNEALAENNDDKVANEANKTVLIKIIRTFM